MYSSSWSAGDENTNYTMQMRKKKHLPIYLANRDRMYYNGIIIVVIIIILWLLNYLIRGQKGARL